jgi:hypothetical protein
MTRRGPVAKKAGIHRDHIRGRHDGLSVVEGRDHTVTLWRCLDLMRVQMTLGTSAPGRGNQGPSPLGAEGPAR